MADAEQHVYKFNVSMGCGGCSGGCSGAHSKPKLTLECVLPIGVKEYTVSLDEQTAVVTADPSLSYAKVLRTIATTGKKVNIGEIDSVEQSVVVKDE
ncbi:hypothetical protein V8F33_009405 [Rhypophila sp. PSN 637]